MVVDVARVRSDSAAAKDIQRQMTAIQDVYSAEISKLEDQLRAQDQELQRQQAILSVFNHAGCHDAWNCAGERRHQRYERFSAQSQFGHQPVH